MRGPGRCITRPRREGTQLLDIIERSTRPDRPSTGTRTLEVIDDQASTRRVTPLGFADDTLACAWS